MSIQQAVNKFENATTVDFKQDLTNKLIDLINPISEKARILIDKEKDFVLDVLK